MEREECRCWRGRSHGWLLFTLFCLLLASCCTIASARLLPEFQQVQSRDAEELVVGSGRQESSPAGLLKSQFPKARSLRGDRVLMEFFPQDYGDPQVDRHPSPPPFGRRPIEWHNDRPPVDFRQP